MSSDATRRDRRGPRQTAMIATAFVVSATIALGSGSAAAAPTVEAAAEPPLTSAPAPTTEPGPTVEPQATTPSPEPDGPATPAGDPAPPAEPVDEAPDAIGPIERAMVVLYGDSLAWEAREAFVTSFAGRAEVVQRTFGGTAICDWIEMMGTDALTLRPGVVVVEFSGNNFTSCMLDADGAGLRDGALVDRYRADAESVIEAFVPNGTKVVFAGAPIMGPAAERPALNEVYEQLAADHDGVYYVDAGAAVLDDGRWTDTLSCLAGEPCGGVDDDGSPVNAVRAPDGIHFCPAGRDAVDGVTGACPVWSSGAFRFGAAMAAPVVAALAAAS